VAEVVAVEVVAEEVAEEVEGVADYYCIDLHYRITFHLDSKIHYLTLKLYHKDRYCLKN